MRKITKTGLIGGLIVIAGMLLLGTNKAFAREPVVLGSTSAREPVVLERTSAAKTIVIDTGGFVDLSPKLVSKDSWFNSYTTPYVIGSTSAAKTIVTDKSGYFNTSSGRGVTVHPRPLWPDDKYRIQGQNFSKVIFSSSGQPYWPNTSQEIVCIPSREIFTDWKATSLPDNYQGRMSLQVLRPLTRVQKALYNFSGETEDYSPSPAKKNISALRLDTSAEKNGKTVKVETNGYKKGTYVPGEIIVAFQPGTSEGKIEEIIDGVGGEVKRRLDIIDGRTITVSGDIKTIEYQLELKDAVKFAGPNYIVRNPRTIFPKETFVIPGPMPYEKQRQVFSMSTTEGSRKEETAGINYVPDSIRIKAVSPTLNVPIPTVSFKAPQVKMLPASRFDSIRYSVK